MRYVVLSLLLAAGCKGPPPSSPAENTRATEKKPSSDPVLGAVQNVRGAVDRLVTQEEMASLHLYINTASLAAGTMPTKDQIMKDIASPMGDRKLAKCLEDGAIVLTGAASREGVWAYEKQATTKGGMILKADGVQRMTAEDLRKALNTSR